MRISDWSSDVCSSDLLAERGELADMYGQKAFYSAGYPLLLAPFFKALGSSVGAAIAVNLLLCAVSIWLIHRLTLALSGNRGAGLIAAAVYALWFPGLWNATMLAKENLSTDRKSKRLKTSH